MKKIFLITISLLWYTILLSQNVLYDPVTNRTFKADKYSEIKGSAFLYDKWLPGSATSSHGIYKNLKLKLDAYESVLYFNKEDESYEFQEPVSSFVIANNNDSLRFIKGLTSNGLKPEQFVQVLASGKLNFYRSDIKTVSEMSEINAGMVKTFINSTRYYIIKDGKTEITRLNKEIVEYMNDKKEQVKNYIDANNLSTKKEPDIANLIRYYNTL